MSLDAAAAPGKSGAMKPAGHAKPRTMFEKIWDAHLVRAASADTPAILYVDLHLVHEVTSPQAFTWLREKNLKVRRPERTVASTSSNSACFAGGTSGTGRPRISSGAHPKIRSAAGFQRMTRDSRSTSRIPTGADSITARSRSSLC